MPFWKNQRLFFKKGARFEKNERRFNCIFMQDSLSKEGCTGISSLMPGIFFPKKMMVLTYTTYTKRFTGLTLSSLRKNKHTLSLH